VRFGRDTSRRVILGGSDTGGRSAGSCCFEHGEWYLYRLDIKAGMFRNSHERYAIGGFGRNHILLGDTLIQITEINHRRRFPKTTCLNGIVEETDQQPGASHNLCWQGKAQPNYQTKQETGNRQYTVAD